MSYCASKGGVKMMRNLALELEPLGISINNIVPGAIATSINTKFFHEPVKLNLVKQNIPLGRLGTPEDIAPIVAFFAYSTADF
nr:SDR family oxidoreductase [Scytonema sp. HK-05]